MQQLYNRTVEWCVKNYTLKELHILVRALNKINMTPRDKIFGVCKKSIRKLTD